MGNSCGVASVLNGRAGAPPVLRARPTTKEEISLKQIHPELTLTTVRCTTCGNTFTTRSSRSELVVDTCSNCHPAYTGFERAGLSGSRIERFERRRQLAGRK
jgi:large subunit ribosomal protein L31